MQAVILAAGKSTRTYPLTLTRPKPLLKIINKSILEHNLDALNGIVNEAVIIIGYKGDMIRKAIGKRYKSIYGNSSLLIINHNHALIIL